MYKQLLMHYRTSIYFSINISYVHYYFICIMLRVNLAPSCVAKPSNFGLEVSFPHVYCVNEVWLVVVLSFWQKTGALRQILLHPVNEARDIISKVIIIIININLIRFGTMLIFAHVFRIMSKD